MTQNDWVSSDVNNSEWVNIKNRKNLYVNDEGYVVIASSKLAAWKDKGKTLKKYKNKSRAINYAKSYMRTH